MNPLFSKMLTKDVAPMNRQVMEGMAVSAMKHAEEYLDAALRSISASFPPSVRYIGYKRCTPQEEYEETTRSRNSTHRTYNIAQSTIYLVKYFFEFLDPATNQVVPITRYMYLPYVLKGGIIMLGGTLYHLIPVLSDKVFTPFKTSIFVRLTMDRNTIERLSHTVFVNDRREVRYVAWATIYRNKADRQKAKEKHSLLANAETALTHYLFARYGFVETFRRYAGIIPEVGGPELMKRAKSEEWVVYHSAGTALEQKARSGNRHATLIHLAVRQKDVSPELDALIIGFFYILDHFPDRFKPTIDSLEDRASWVILIGKIVFGEQYGENKLYKDISEHLENLNSFLDSITRDKLLELGVKLENYYDLLNYLQVNFNNILLSAENNRLCVYGKNYEVLHYVLFDIFSGFTKVGFELNKIANRRPLTRRDIFDALTSYFRMGTVFDLASGKIVTEAVSYSGDHLYPKITAVATEQENRSGSNHGKSEHVIVGPQHRLDLSMITTGSILNFPKSNPAPIARTNPWASIDPITGTVLPHPTLGPLFESYQAQFKL